VLGLSVRGAQLGVCIVCGIRLEHLCSSSPAPHDVDLAAAAHCPTYSDLPVHPQQWAERRRLGSSQHEPLPTVRACSSAKTSSTVTTSQHRIRTLPGGHFVRLRAAHTGSCAAVPHCAYWGASPVLLSMCLLGRCSCAAVHVPTGALLLCCCPCACWGAAPVLLSMCLLGRCSCAAAAASCWQWASRRVGVCASCATPACAHCCTGGGWQGREGDAGQ
jgi:hypothetical protein